MAATASSPSKSQILSLFRSFIRVSRQFPDYNIRDYTKRRGFLAFCQYPDCNFREYTKRRAVDEFRQNATLSEASSVSKAFSFGKRELVAAKEQAAIYSVICSIPPPPPTPPIVYYEDSE